MKLNLPNLYKIVQLFFKVLWKKLNSVEKSILAFLVFLLVLNFTGFYGIFFNANKKVTPLPGGVVVEGIIGEASYINPMYATSEVDKTITSLVFSGLVGYNKQREIIPVLAERWEVSENKKDYKFYLKKDLKWHDGAVFNAEDVAYTVAVLQNPDYNESLKPVWEGIAIEKIDDFTVIFHLQKAYPLFLDNLTIGILPRHLWVDIPVKYFAQSALNINAVGMGPYKIEKTNKTKEGKVDSIKMTANNDFVRGKPFIENIEVKFYIDKAALLKGFSSREFTSFGMYSYEDSKVAKQTRGYSNYSVKLPQYIALFLNYKKNTALADKSVREALAYGVDKAKINETGTYGAGVVINSPILPGYLGYSEAETKKYDYDQKAANTVLNQGSWSDQNNDGIKEKGELKLEFNLVTLDDPQFVRIAESLSEQWKAVGVKINIQKAEKEALSANYLNGRNYDILLAGENLGNDPDPYSYWHSTQAGFPGLNFSGFANGEVDKLLEEARQSTDANIRMKDYKKFQEIIAEELPAIFLYQPVYVYKTYSGVRGIDLNGISSTWDRFYDIGEWYVKYKAE